MLLTSRSSGNIDVTVLSAVTMENLCIPPSPNWYSHHVSDGTAGGLYSFASKNSVVLFDTSEGPPLYKDTILVSSARVICVAFCRSEVGPDSVPSLLTVSDDRCLRVWDIRTKKIQRETLSHSSVVDADWRGNLSTSVLFSGEKGSLHVWDLVENSVTPMQTYSPQLVSIVKSHPKNPDLAALGYKSGLIIVQGLKKGKNVVYRLKGHTEEILSLSWSVCEDTTQSQLASTALDRTLRVWDVEAEKTVNRLAVPGSAKNRRTDSNQKGKQWVVATWVTTSPGTVACSTALGDVCLCDTSSPRSGWSAMAASEDSAGHTRCIFNLSVVGTSEKSYVVSTSLDRNIVFWDVLLKRSLYCIPSLGGFPYYLGFSPIACASLAVGAGDNTVKVWKTDCPSNPYSCASFWQGIRGRVMTASWHPKKEDLVAFGTDDGMVGIVHVGGKQTVISTSHHKQTTYVVCWAELPDLASEDKADKTYLLSCGDGRVKVHHFPKMDREALDLQGAVLKEESTGSRWTVVCFHADLRLLVLGGSDGSVHVYSSKTLKKVALLEAQRKAIENAVWHPVHTASSPQESGLRYTLACSSCEGPIHLYDLGGLAEKREQVLHLAQSTTQLVGHGAKVVSLSWSTFREGYLASASYDGTVQVWDAIRAVPVANYRGHWGRAISCCWSPVDPDVIFSGGEDCAVRSWRVSEQRDRLPPSKAEKQKMKAAGLPPPVASQAEGDGEACKPASGVSSEGRESPARGAAPVQQSRPSQPGGGRKKKAPKSFFPVFSAQENKPKESVANDCMLLAARLARGDREHFAGEDGHLNVFLDAEGVLDAVDAEIAQHKRDLNFGQAFQMMVWRGNIAEALREAASARKLNDTLVALAPSVSRTLWLELCEKYAEQLSSEGEHHRAALYLLTCRKVREALQLLSSNGLTREALAVAKAHLVEGDPEVADIYVAWAEKAKSTGSYEQAAKCYLGAGDAARAVKVLLGRRNAQSRRAAAYIAKKYGLLAEADAAFRAALEAALEQEDWNTAEKLTEEQEKPDVFLCLIGLHRCLVRALAAVKAEERVRSEGCEADGQESDAVVWRGRKGVSDRFVAGVGEASESSGVAPFQSSERAAELEKLVESTRSPATDQEALFRCSVGIMLALLDAKDYEVHLSRALYSVRGFSRVLFGRICSFLFTAELGPSDGSTSLSSYEFVVLDSLWRKSLTTAVETFECPASSSHLLARFKSLKGQEAAKVSAGREALGLLFCAAVLDSYDHEENSPVSSETVATLRRLETLLLSPPLACIEHLEKQLRIKEELLLQKRVQVFAESLKNASEVAAEAAVSSTYVEGGVSLLEKDCEVLKENVRELREATRDCCFPDTSALLAKAVTLLDGSVDEEVLKLKNLLTAWRALILNEAPGTGAA